MDAEDAPRPYAHVVLRWQKKYGIGDGDPMLACLELLDIYFTARVPVADEGKPPTFEEFRESLETLQQRSREFTRHSGELIQRMQTMPKCDARRSSNAVALGFTLIGAVLVGVLLGKFAL